MQSHANAAGTEGVASAPALLVYELANCETLAQALAGAELLPDAEALGYELADALSVVVGVGPVVYGTLVFAEDATVVL